VGYEVVNFENDSTITSFMPYPPLKIGRDSKVANFFFFFFAKLVNIIRNENKGITEATPRVE
jgi:hypothetical protein